MSSPSEPLEHALHVGGIEIAFFEWNPLLRGREPTLFLAHATGFHARCWDPMIRHLGERHIVAVDLRGHGRSEKVAIDHWRVFGEDLAALVRELEFDDVIGVGHSMGAHALVDAVAIDPRPYRGLVLLDPVIRDPAGYEVEDDVAWGLGEELHPTAKRRNHFDSPRAMFERFEDRFPYSIFDREALWSYCEHGLLPAPDGDGFILACPPATEASVYMTSRSNGGVLASALEVNVPVLVVRAMEGVKKREIMDFSPSPTWPGLFRHFPNAYEIHLPELTHFLPMQQPARIASLVLEHGATRCSGDRPPAS